MHLDHLLVCRQNISDLSQAILESIWLIGFEGSSCECPLVQTASLFDGLSFDDFPAFEYGRSFAGVDVSRR
jgi:hypothetical protein